jgi:signal transduction histidine kinase
MSDSQKTIPNEFERVLELSEFDLDYSDLNEHLKDLTRLAANVAGNLISNAIKFTPKKGSVHVKMDIDKLKEGKRLIIEVSDTGVGINEKQLHLMQNGESISTVGTIGEQGFGLSLVKHLVDKSQGKMEIKSELGKGTTFRIELPR